LYKNSRNEEYPREKATLTPLNDTVDEIIDYIVQLTEGSTKQYLMIKNIPNKLMSVFLNYLIAILFTK
jgi:hypothetical protein